MAAIPEEAPAPDSRPTLGMVAELFNEARREKRKLLPRWNKFYRLLRNRSWSNFRESWVPSPSASEIFPTIATLVSWMTDQRPRTFVSAAPDTMEFVRPPNAELVQSMTKDMQQSLDSWWINRDMGTQNQMALYDTFTFGCGGLGSEGERTDRGSGWA